MKSDLEEAIANYSKAIELDPNYAEAYLSRGIARAANNSLDGAIADFTKIIEMKPPSNLVLPAAFFNRGLARERKGDYDGSIEDYTNALRLNPRAKTYTTRCGARNSKRDFTGAVADCTRALEIDNRDANAYNNRGVARYWTEDLDGSIGDDARKRLDFYSQKRAYREP